MAHNTRVRADLAAWNVATPVTGAEFDALDAGQYKSINGDDGGTWAPAAAIVIGGAGFNLSGANHEVSGTLEISGDLTTDDVYSPPRIEIHGATGDLDVNSGGDVNVKNGGDIIFESGGNWRMDGGSTATVYGTITGTGGGALAGTWAGSPTWSATHTWSGTITSSGGTFSGTWAGGPIWTGTHTFQGNVSHSGNSTHTGDIYLSGTGKIQERVVSGADSDQTYDAGDADMIRVGTLSASRVYTIGSGSSGQKLTITKMYQASANTITLSGTIDSLGGTLPVIKNQSSGDMCSITLRCYGAGWCIEQATFVP